MTDKREMRACLGVLLVCLAVASAASGSKGTVKDGSRAAARARDMAAIQNLHERDVAATLAGDVAAIAELWTDDIVLIEPGQPPQVGKQAILAARQRRQAAAPGFHAAATNRSGNSRNP